MQVELLLNNFASEFLVAITIASATWVLTSASSWRTRRRFDAVFGRSASKGKVGILLSALAIKESESGYVDVLKREPDGSETTRRFTRLRGLISKKDVGAFEQIASLSSSINKLPVRLMIDDEPNQDLTGNIVLLGGPLSNALVARLQAAWHGRKGFFEFAPFEHDHGTVAVRDMTTDEYFATDEHFEYAIILRDRNPYDSVAKRHVWILAGGGVDGTLSAAQYVRNNWRDLKTRKAPLAILIRLSRGIPASYEVIRRYDGDKVSSVAGQKA
tara:strand:+ start:1316 stop:2131 length:816 start_codon:yes stop_codon:yes gene_type:complete